ncbi:unnamed protein product [Leptosia nina]|uniref:Uncharacterized protein n=1 Tax=Leptosia nina TaxID=320188 RepID=A0AAV1K2X2_9NEOP
MHRCRRMEVQPCTKGGSMPNTSSSVPFLATTTAGYRRGSGCHGGSHSGSQRGSQGSGIFSHMVRLFPNQSATGSPRRASTTFQSSSAYASVRQSTDDFIRKFPSLNTFVYRFHS